MAKDKFKRDANTPLNELGNRLIWWGVCVTVVVWGGLVLVLGLERLIAMLRSL